MYMLAEHPDIENRLRQEVLDKVGPAARPTYDDMRDMRFMRAFLNGDIVSFCRKTMLIVLPSLEVLRLYPPV